MNFSNLKEWKTPRGNVVELAIDGAIAWKKRQSSVGDLPVGSSVFLYEYSKPAEYIVVHQGNPNPAIYDSSCDGTWLLRKDIHSERVFDNDSDNYYKNSNIHPWLNSTSFMTDSERSIIKEVKITVGENSDPYSWVSTKIFLLSLAEVGHSASYATVEGCVLSYFDGVDNSKRIAYLNGTAAFWWTRTPDNSTEEDEEEYACVVKSDGNYWSRYCAGAFGVRPACILPSSTLIDENFNIIA